MNDFGSGEFIHCEVVESPRKPWLFAIKDDNGSLRGFFMSRDQAEGAAMKLRTLGYIEDPE